MTELFQRPANYWLRHADRHKQNGDLIRAAVLQRHATHAEPGSDAARMEYAHTLHELHCYEASSREAFRALAAHPDQPELYGLIGCNLIALGQRRQGLDALDLYMRTTPTASAPWHDECCDLTESYDYPFAQRKRKARLEGLLTLASQRIARGDLDGAERALRRAHQPPFQRPNAKRDLIMALYWMHRGHTGNFVQYMQRALERNFFHVPHLASAAMLLYRSGGKPFARILLMRAAAMAHTPRQEQLICFTAAQTNMLFVAQAMLKRSLNTRADRCPLLYDLCVCALKMGRLKEAAQYIHLCREIDPDDIPSECLFARVVDWKEQNISAQELRKLARNVSFYGSCTPEELSAAVHPFWDTAEEGPAGLAEAIRQDERLRRRLLFLQTLPVEWPLVLLDSVCQHLPAEECEALLREVLMQHPADSAAKRYALQMLRRMEAPGPYAVWTHDRFWLMDPARIGAPEPTFRQRFLTRFLHKLGKECGREIIPWALETISAMPRAKQLRLIGDPWKVWPLAFAMRFRALCGLPPVHIPLQTMSTLRLNALKDALRTLHNID